MLMLCGLYGMAVTRWSTWSTGIFRYLEVHKQALCRIMLETQHAWRTNSARPCGVKGSAVSRVTREQIRLLMLQSFSSVTFSAGASLLRRRLGRHRAT